MNYLVQRQVRMNACVRCIVYIPLGRFLSSFVRSVLLLVLSSEERHVEHVSDASHSHSLDALSTETKSLHGK